MSENKIKMTDVNLMEVPKFFFESNQLFKWIASADDFKELRKKYPDFYDAKRNPTDRRIEFGFRSEHTGDETLGEFMSKYKK